MNVMGMYIWYLSGQSSYFASILWCNSIAIELGYEIFRWQAPITYHNLRLCIPLNLDIIAHIAPLFILYYLKEPWQLSHSLLSLSCNLLWGGMNLFDLNYIYQFHPKITKTQCNILWIFTLTGHFIPAIEIIL